MVSAPAALDSVCPYPSITGTPNTARRKFITRGASGADPCAGTFSSCRTAMGRGRRSWGCDLNPEGIEWRPTISDYEHSPDTPEQQYDREYPFYEFMEAGLTEEQFNQIAAHLLRNVSADELARAPGIGIQKAREFRRALHDIQEPDETSLLQFSALIEVEEE